jgi:hypothetical protein
VTPRMFPRIMLTRCHCPFPPTAMAVVRRQRPAWPAARAAIPSPLFFVRVPARHMVLPGEAAVGSRLTAIPDAS